jgi:hypothetical protein
MAKKNQNNSATVNFSFKAMSNNASAETVSAVTGTISAFKLDMLISRDTDKKARIEKRLSSDSAENMSELKINALREELAELEKALAGYKAELAKIDSVRIKVVSDIMDAGSEKTCAENLFRVLACFGDASLNKYALKGVCTSWTPELDAAMTTAHSLKFSEKTGAPVLGKDVKAAFTSAMNIIKGAVRGAVSVPENPYFNKVSVNINMRDLGMLHETFVTGASLDYKKDKKTGAVSLDSSEYVLKTRIRRPRGKNAVIDASGFWGMAVNCIILHICE